MYTCVPSCTIVQPCVQSRAIMYRCVPLRTIAYHRVPSCTVVYRCVPSYTIAYRRIPSRTIVYRRVPLRTVAYRRVPSCVSPDDDHRRRHVDGETGTSAEEMSRDRRRNARPPMGADAAGDRQVALTITTDNSPHDAASCRLVPKFVGVILRFNVVVCER